ncbi:MAG TPA: ribonuclease HII [Bacteroidales bacterium]|nr:ribonuclease HII [Bacteroidales bacterium]
MLKLRFIEDDKLEAGCDEAGRGCLAGPVFAAAVVLPPDFKNELLNDSKKLSKVNRDALRSLIEKEALAWAVASMTAEEIDEINILNASIYSMHKAVGKLKTEAQRLLIDGNRFKKYKSVEYHTIVKGDEKYMAIAAASVLAKTHRDEYMEKIHSEFPDYDWKNNKGYPTPKHKEAIRLHGITPFHRKTFRMSEQLKISF